MLNDLLPTEEKLDFNGLPRATTLNMYKWVGAAVLNIIGAAGASIIFNCSNCFNLFNLRILDIVCLN